MEKVEVNSERWLSVDDLEGEVWKDTEYPYYQISNYGRLKRLSHVIIPNSTNKHAHRKVIGERICKVTISRNYYGFRVSVNNHLVCVLIHRLVAKAFVPNPHNYDFVNHRNENKLDNRSVNLEWCTAKYNTNYASCQIRRANTLRTNRRARLINVCQYTTDGVFVRCFSTKGELEDNGFCVKTVLRTCRKQQLTSDGYVWTFKNDEFKSPEFRDSKGGTIRKKVECYSLDGELLHIFDNLKEAATFVGNANNRRSAISECACGRKKQAYGYIWKYKED